MKHNTVVTPFVVGACKKVSDEAYNRQTTAYKSREELSAFVGYLYNAGARYFETKTVQHLNNAINAGRAQGRYRLSVRVAKAISAHAFSEGKFGGKMDKNRFSKLKAEWDNILKEAIQKELDRDASTSSKDASQWELEIAMLRLVKKAASEAGGKHGIGDIKTALEHAVKAAELSA